MRFRRISITRGALQTRRFSEISNNLCPISSSSCRRLNRCCACARMQGASGGTSAGHDWQVALPAGSPRAAIAAAARRTFVSSGGTSVSHDRQAAAAAGSPHRDRRGRSQDVRELGVDTLRASRDHLGRQQWQTRTCFGMSHASGPI